MTDNALTRVPVYTSEPDDPVGSGDTPPWYARAGNRLLSFLDNFGYSAYEPDDPRVVRSKAARNRLLGISDEERPQFWPERMVRSGLTLAGDVATGNVPPPGLRREDLTDIPADPDKVGGQPQDDLIQRVQDMAGLAMSGGLAGTGERGMVVGSGATMPSHQPISVARHFKDVAYPHAKMERGDWARYNRAVDNGDHVEVDLPLRSLNATQKTVNPDFMSVRNDELPAVLKKGGEYYVQDGHHRLMREAASGKQTARVRLYDVDPSTKDPRQLTLLSGNDAAAPIAALEYLTTGQLDDAARAVAGRKYEQLDRNQQQRVQKLALETVYAKNDAAAPVSALERAPVWYSPVEHALEQSTQGSATGAQWLATIRNSRGVKPEELDWTGLRQFLEERADKPVTRPELHEYLRDNRVELQDVTKGEGRPMNWDELSRSQKIEVRELWEDAIGAGPGSARRVNDSEFQKWFDGMDSTERLDQGFDWSVPTKYHDYALPGGENYREHLITMPGKMKEAQDLLNDPGRDLRTREFEELHRTAQGYRSSHWDEPNIVAHVRSNVREMPEPGGFVLRNRNSGNTTRAFKTEQEAADHLLTLPEKLHGSLDIVPSDKPIKKRSLHLEEVQSDWHQAGRRKGYKEEVPKEKRERIVARDRETRNAFDDAVLNAYKEHFGNHDNVTMRHVNSWRDRVLQADGKIDELPSWANVPEVKHTAQEYSNAFNEAVALDRKKQGVPDAPWKKTWHELALRRMIRLAAEEGMDRVSWTPGEAQAARYDLSKTIDKLFFMHNSDGTFDLRAQPKGGSTMELGKSVPADKLPDMVGKEMAKKLVEQEKGKGGNFSGLDLKVGGEGMRGFYDKMMVQAAEKIGKEYGVKVREGSVTVREINRTVDDRYSVTGDKRIFDTRAEAEKAAAQPVWYFDIPPAMREAALSRGMPLFSGGKMFVPAGTQERSEK